jgi:hypothetical protein
MYANYIAYAEMSFESQIIFDREEPRKRGMPREVQTSSSMAETYPFTVDPFGPTPPSNPKSISFQSLPNSFGNKLMRWMLRQLMHGQK